MKTYIYRSTYSISWEKWRYTMDDEHRLMLETLWMAYSITKLIRSAYFDIIRVRDGKYSLTVQKEIDETWHVKYIINEN